MSSAAVGIGCLVLFALSQGARDAFFGSVFQSVSLWLVALLACGAPVALFGTITLLRRPADLAKLLAAPSAFLALNVTTAVGWLSYFHALSHLEPAVVAMLYNGIGPLSVLALQAMGATAAGEKPGPLELAGYLGVAATVGAVVGVVLTGRSGLDPAAAAASLDAQAGALAAVLVGGATIAASHMIARRFNDAGVASDSLMGLRFVLALALAALAEALLGSPSTRPGPTDLLLLAAIALMLITLPSYLLQLGNARTSALAVSVFRSLAPACVFLVQQLDNRLRFSGATLACIAAFCVFTLGASLLRGWSEVRQAPGDAMPSPDRDASGRRCSPP